MPSSAVSRSVAENCVRLAQAVLAHAQPYATQSKPKVTTRVQDAFFAMKPAVFQKMSKTGDFWRYYISRMEAGEMAIEAAVTEYYKKYFSKDIKFEADGA
jgi:hypothetical protein